MIQMVAAADVDSMPTPIADLHQSLLNMRYSVELTYMIGCVLNEDKDWS